MAQLQPAGFFSTIVSYLFPKEVAVQVRSETLPNGQMQITPVFTIDGKDVPANLIAADKHQTILGYTVVLTDHSLNVHKETQAKPTRLSKKRAAECLSRLKQMGIPIRSRDGKVQPRIETVKPDVNLELQPDDSLRIRSEFNTSSGIVLDKPSSLEQLKQDDGWYAAGDDLLKIETTGTALDRVLISKDGNDVLTGEDVPRFLKKLDEQATHIGAIEKNPPLQDLTVLSEKPDNCANVHGTDDSLSVCPSLVYPGRQGRLYEQKPSDLEHFEAKGGGFRRVTDGWLHLSPEAIRGFNEACDELVHKLGSLDNIKSTDIPVALSSLSAAARKDPSWSNPWSVYFSKEVSNAHRLVDVRSNVEFRLNIVESDGRSLLELDPMYNHERFRLTHSEVESSLANGDNWIRRKNTWIKVDNEKCNDINDGIDQLDLHRGPNGFRFPASRREEVINVFSVLGSIEQSAAYAEFLIKLADFTKIEDVPLPSSLRPEISLRPYQKHGFNWLAVLHRFGLNGILADDMGLGKTLQALAAIQGARELTRSRFPSLIICPTSVVNNWNAEVRKFFRDTHVTVYTGNKRDRKLRELTELFGFSEFGLFAITSYDVARRDHDKLSRIRWLYVVVDEGHNIKNPDAERTKAIKTIHGQHKLILTGTPIQNNLEELWSLFDFAMPGYLGTRSEFRDQYSRGDKVDWNAVRQHKGALKDRVHPFVMRRLKEHVAKDLPLKIVIDQKVELSPRQVVLYKGVIESADYKHMVQEIDQKGVSRARVLILTVYTELRAICNHPALAGPTSRCAEQYNDSGKLEALKELIEEIVEGRHRTLLFSQSVRMLDMIQRFFKEWQINTIRLDGSTPANRRLELVDEFNRNAAIHCFLISTKAGGTGLNLTGADTVVFYDHDWNPANDAQAQDRAYRIGQTKPVTVYRLISKGTIEEKIIERQLIKKSLADEIIGADEEVFKDLTKEELLALFKLDEDVGES